MWVSNMATTHERSRRKSTGGLYRRNAKRKKRNLTGEFAATTLGETEVKQKKSRGETRKNALKAVETVNVAQDDGTTTTAEIEAVVDNEANPDFVRRDIITKGTVLETSEGRVRVTSRPGQDGTLNAEPVEE